MPAKRMGITDIFVMVLGECGHRDGSSPTNCLSEVDWAVVQTRESDSDRARK